MAGAMVGSSGLRARPAQAGVGSSSTATTTSATAASPVPPRVCAWRSTAAGTSSPRPIRHVGDGRSGTLAEASSAMESTRSSSHARRYTCACPSARLPSPCPPVRPAGRALRTTRQPASNPGVGVPTCASAHLCLATNGDLVFATANPARGATAWSSSYLDQPAAYVAADELMMLWAKTRPRTVPTMIAVSAMKDDSSSRLA
jgi:hypothetical protein